MPTIKTAIIGAAGYAAGELALLLMRHPHFELCAAVSGSAAGKELGEVHARLRGATNLQCTAALEEDVDLVFLCRGHGASAATLAELNLPDSTRIVDLSRDFRAGSDESAGFLYGLPEAFKAGAQQELYAGRNIANPGCFATCILLASLPLAQSGRQLNRLNVTAITGASGAGYAPRSTTHYPWRNENVQAYNVFTHPHLPEITTTLGRANGGQAALDFVPLRGPFTRGILASLTMRQTTPGEDVAQVYADFYRDHPFVHVVDEQPDLAQVIHTNNCLLHVQMNEGTVHVVSVIDNLVKGAAGQAVQNANLVFQLPQTCGLTAAAEGV